jgi:hypothetical protein
MNPPESLADCQIPCLPLIAEGQAEIPPQSLRRRLKLAIRRRLTPRQERKLKKYSNNLVNWLYRIAGRDAGAPVPETQPKAARLRAGDQVRVRSKEEIQATLDHWRQLKGCIFMAEMWPYCGTTQRILRPMKRFVDERDLRVKKSTGIVLLEGVMCQGTAEFGACDRSCLLFWREEWLEKIE